MGTPGQTKCNEVPYTRKEVIKQYKAKSQEKVNKSGYKVVEVSYESAPIDAEDE